MTVAWIRKTSEDTNFNFEISTQGFEKRGWEVRRFIDRSEIDLHTDHLVHGSVRDINYFLPGLPVCDYPGLLKKHLHREVKQATLEDAKKQAMEERFFIKPYNDHKAFRGRVVETSADLHDLQRRRGSMKIWMGEPMEFYSEWRVYVINGEVEEVSRYCGDPLRFPDRQTIQNMVDEIDFISEFALDVGINRFGTTTLVEYNHPFSLGNYGLRPSKYARLIEGGWTTARRKNWVLPTTLHDLIQACEEEIDRGPPRKDSTPDEQRFPTIIRMALTTLPLSKEQLAEHFKTAPKGVEAWARGEVQPVESAREDYVEQIKQWAIEYKEA